MRLSSLNRSNIFIVISVLLTAIAIGFSGLLINSNYSAIFLGVVILAAPVLFFLIKRPLYAISIFLLYSFLPYGLVSATLYYYVNRFSPVLITIFWLFYVIRRGEKISINISTIFLFLFILWSLITLFWTPDLNSGFFILQLYFTRFIVFVLIIPNMIRTREQLNFFLNTLVISGWLLVILCFITIFTTGYSSGIRLQVFDENSNYVGMVALMMLAGISWKMIESREAKSQVGVFFGYLYLLFVIGIVALTGSRGSAISLTIILLALLYWKPTRPLGIAGFLFLIIGAFLAPFVFSTTIDRFFIIDQANSLLGGRESLWPAAWMLIKDHPWFGVGIGNSPVEMINYLRLFTSTGDASYASGHNPILTIWMETGVPGMILYLSSLASAIILFIRQYYKNGRWTNDWLRPYYYIIGAIFLGYMVSWIKGGGIESDKTYFLILCLLLIPSMIEPNHTQSEARLEYYPRNDSRNA